MMNMFVGLVLWLFLQCAVGSGGSGGSGSGSGGGGGGSSVPPLGVGSGAAVPSRVVATKHGRLQGIVLAPEGGRHMKPVEAFLGVPYASPPTRASRFAPTRAPAPWDGVRSAQRFGPVCPQRLPDISNETEALQHMPRGRLDTLKRLLPLLQQQSEDCLYLNVYAPAQAGPPETMHRQNPVIVFIHGESFEWNSGNPYDGSVLAAYASVVVVTLNYRLGVLGFLNANPIPHTKARVANYGLMDQIAALHWVQENIGAFGGDAANVTLMGHGTGAACVNFLVVSPAVVPGLFHRVILMSGSALSSWALVREPAMAAVNLAKQLNCSVPPLHEMARRHEEVVSCLKDTPLDLLLSASVQAPAFLPAFGPTIDGVVIRADFQRWLGISSVGTLVSGGAQASHIIMSHNPSTGNGASSSTKRSEPRSRPAILFGVVTGEALSCFGESELQRGFEGNRRDQLLRTYVRNAYRFHLHEIFLAVTNEYTDWERTVQHPINTRDAAVQALGDARVVAPLVQAADALLQTPSRSPLPPAFFYVFDYQSRDAAYPQRLGAPPGDELAYIFGAPLSASSNNGYRMPTFARNFSKAEVALSESLLLYWTNFARSGNPNEPQRQEAVLAGSKERNRFKALTWEPYDPIHQRYLEIGLKPRVKNHFRAHQLSVWLRLVPALHRSGDDDAADSRHHRFPGHDDPTLYVGAPILGVEQSSQSPDLMIPPFHHHHHHYDTDEVPTTCVPLHPDSGLPPSSSGGVLLSGTNITSGDALDAAANNGQYPYSAYSTALSVTIAIGCSLLILNVLIFAGVYYQRDKRRLEAKGIVVGPGITPPPPPVIHGHHHHQNIAHVRHQAANESESCSSLAAKANAMIRPLKAPPPSPAAPQQQHNYPPDLAPPNGSATLPFPPKQQLSIGGGQGMVHRTATLPRRIGGEGQPLLGLHPHHMQQHQHQHHPMAGLVVAAPPQPPQQGQQQQGGAMHEMRV